MKHGLKSEHFFSAEEKRRIREITDKTESRTIGEVAVMIVESSDHYFEAEVMGGILFSSLISLATSVIFFRSSLWFYIPLNFFLFFPAQLFIRRVPALKFHFVGAHRKEHAVRLRAVRAFYEKGLYKTRKNTGILFFISLFEKKVRVLADSGIHEKIGQETLNRLALHVSRGIRDNRAGDALCEAIAEAKDLLAAHFPVAKNDANDLPEDVMTE